MLMVNSIFPRNLAKVGNTLSKKIINISTDCAYNGKKGNYTENDLFSAEDIYGISKIGGESNLSMNLRTSIVGEEKGSSHSLLEWTISNKGKEINGYRNHYWNGVTTLYLAEIIKKIIDEDLYKTGTYHIHSPNSVSKYELLKIFNEVYNLNIVLNKIDANEKIDRTLFSINDLSSIVCTKKIEEQVLEMKDFFSTKEN
jgi:dTDP-4-dehydrorhamnose reductase